MSLHLCNKSPGVKVLINKSKLNLTSTPPISEHSSTNKEQKEITQMTPPTGTITIVSVCIIPSTLVPIWDEIKSIFSSISDIIDKFITTHSSNYQGYITANERTVFKIVFETELLAMKFAVTFIESLNLFIEAHFQSVLDPLNLYEIFEEKKLGFAFSLVQSSTGNGSIVCATQRPLCTQYTGPDVEIGGELLVFAESGDIITLKTVWNNIGNYLPDIFADRWSNVNMPVSPVEYATKAFAKYCTQKNNECTLSIVVLSCLETGTMGRNIQKTRHQLISKFNCENQSSFTNKQASYSDHNYTCEQNRIIPYLVPKTLISEIVKPTKGVLLTFLSVQLYEAKVILSGDNGIYIWNTVRRLLFQELNEDIVVPSRCYGKKKKENPLVICITDSINGWVFMFKYAISAIEWGLRIQRKIKNYKWNSNLVQNTPITTKNKAETKNIQSNYQPLLCIAAVYGTTSISRNKSTKLLHYKSHAMTDAQYLSGYARGDEFLIFPSVYGYLVEDTDLIQCQTDFFYYNHNIIYRVANISQNNLNLPLPNTKEWKVHFKSEDYSQSNDSKKFNNSNFVNLSNRSVQKHTNSPRIKAVLPRPELHSHNSFKARLKQLYPSSNKIEGKLVRLSRNQRKTQLRTGQTKLKYFNLALNRFRYIVRKVISNPKAHKSTLTNSHSTMQSTEVYPLSNISLNQKDQRNYKQTAVKLSSIKPLEKLQKGNKLRYGSQTNINANNFNHGKVTTTLNGEIQLSKAVNLNTRKSGRELKLKILTDNTCTKAYKTQNSILENHQRLKDQINKTKCPFLRTPSSNKLEEIKGPVYVPPKAHLNTVKLPCITKQNGYSAALSGPQFAHIAREAVHLGTNGHTSRPHSSMKSQGYSAQAFPSVVSKFKTWTDTENYAQELKYWGDSLRCEYQNVRNKKYLYSVYKIFMKIRLNWIVPFVYFLFKAETIPQVSASKTIYCLGLSEQLQCYIKEDTKIARSVAFLRWKMAFSNSLKQIFKKMDKTKLIVNNYKFKIIKSHRHHIQLISSRLIPLKNERIELILNLIDKLLPQIMHNSIDSKELKPMLHSINKNQSSSKDNITYSVQDINTNCISYSELNELYHLLQIYR